MITIHPVQSKKDLRAFIDFPTVLYRDNPYFTPYIFEDEISNLTPSKNPASSYCDFQSFIARKNGQIVGRVTAIINRFSNEKYHEKRIRFNRIDFIEDYDVFITLMDAVKTFGKAHGMTEMAGPLGYSDQDKEGLLTQGFDQLNMFVTFYTASYYVDFFERYGFVKDATWNEYRIKVPKQIPELLVKISKRVLERNHLHLVRVKNKRFKTLAPYIKKIFRLMNVTYDHLYGYVPVKEELMDMLAKQYIPLVNLDYIQLVCDEQENLVAFGLMIPSPVKALKKHRGHLFPFGIFSFFKELKQSRVLDMLLVAVDPQYKDSGVLSLIFVDALTNAIKNNIEYAETGPELLTNQHIQSLWKHFEHTQHKSRSAFVRPIEE